MTKVKIPQEVFEKDNRCGEFIVAINERLDKVAKIEKELKYAKEICNRHLLERLAATGQDQFKFSGIGTFFPKTADRISYPTADEGGREAATKWLLLCLEKGVISPEELITIQQARLNTDPIVAIEEAVERYNQQQALNGLTDTIPPSPFNHFKQVALSFKRA